MLRVAGFRHWQVTRHGLRPACAQRSDSASVVAM